MAPQVKVQTAEAQARQESLAAEWANVGMCGGTFRPANHQSQPASKRGAQIDINESDWQPNNRCCD